MGYFFTASSNEPQKTHHLCSRVCYGRLRLSKIVDFGSNRKGIWDFLLVVNSNLGPILHRFWNTATHLLKIAFFHFPLVYCPSQVTSLDFLVKIYGFW